METLEPVGDASHHQFSRLLCISRLFRPKIGHSHEEIRQHSSRMDALARSDESVRSRFDRRIQNGIVAAGSRARYKVIDSPRPRISFEVRSSKWAKLLAPSVLNNESQCAFDQRRRQHASGYGGGLHV